MAESLEVEISFPTSIAVQNAQAFQRSILATEEALDALDGTSKAATESLNKVASAAAKDAEALNGVKQAAADAAKSTEEVGKKSEEAGEKAKKSYKGIKDETTELDRFTSNLAGQVRGLVTGYLGLQSVFSILETLQQRTEQIAQAQGGLVAGRLSLEQQFRGVEFNLGLPPTDKGAQTARDIVKRFVQESPGATVQQISGAIGSAASFGLSPQNEQQFHTIKNFVRTAGQLDLSQQTTGDLVKLAAATGSLTPDKSQKLLSQFLEAARTTPVENQAEFSDAFIRSVLPLVNRGVPIEEAAGLFSAAAVGEPSALRTATRVQQVTAVFEGRDEKSASAMFQRALSGGLLTKDQIKNFQAMQGQQKLTPEDEEKIRRTNYDLAEQDRKAQEENTQFKRAQEQNNNDLQRTRALGHDTLAIRNRIQSRQEQHDNEMRSIDERRRVLQSTLQSDKEKTLIGVEAQAYQALPLNERRRIFFELARRAGSGAERDQLLRDAGASPEEMRYVSNIIAPDATAQGQSTRAAVAGASPTGAAASAEQFEGRALARSTQADQLAKIAEAEGVSTEQVLTFSDFERNVDKDVKLFLNGPDAARMTMDIHAHRASYESGGGLMNVNLTQMTQEGLKANIASRNLIETVNNWQSQLKPNEREWAKQNGFDNAWPMMEHDLLDYAHLRRPSEQMNAVRKWSNWFFGWQAGVLEFRKKGAPAQQKKATTRPTTPGGGGGAGGGTSPRASAGGDVDVAGSTGSTGGVAVASSFGGGGATYNVNIGTVVSRGEAEDLDFIGPLEGVS